MGLSLRLLLPLVTCINVGVCVVSMSQLLITFLAAASFPPKLQCSLPVTESVGATADFLQIPCGCKEDPREETVSQRGRI